MARHDARRTAMANGTGDMLKPATYWKKALGGALFQGEMLAGDVNGDGKIEIVHIRAGHLVAKQADDTLVWETPSYGLTQVVAIDDLDGDGKPDVVAYSSDHAYVFAGATGALEWAEPDGEMGTLGTVRVADVDGDGKAELIIEECGCCSVNSMHTGFVYSFAAGFTSPKLVWTLPSTACGAFQSLTVLDASGDGALKVMNGTHQTLMLLDGKTGAKLAETPQITTWLSFSQCRPVIVGPTKQQDALCILSAPYAPNVGQHKVFLLRYTASPPALGIVWSADVAPDDGGDVAFVDPFGDLDGDGVPEVVFSAKSGGAWSTTVLDAATGAQLATIPGETVAGTAAIAADLPGTRVVVTTAGLDLHAWRFSRSAVPPITQLFALPGQQLFAEIDPAARRISQIDQRVVALGFGPSSLVSMPTYSADAAPTIAAYAVMGGQPVTVAKTTLPTGVSPVDAWSLPPITQGAPQLGVFRNDGYLVVYDSALTAANVVPGRPGMPVLNYYAPGAWGDLRTTPVVAALDGSPYQRVLVTDSRDALLRLDADTASLVSPPSTAWAATHTTGPTVVPGLAGGSPGIACLSLKEPVANPPDNLVRVLRADGSQVWSVPLERNPLNDLVPGNFGGGKIPGLAVQWGDPGDTLLRTRALSGVDGSTLWNATPLDPGAGQQSSGFSVEDWNGDGIDDVFFQGAGTRILTGTSGAQVASGGPSDAYFLPTLFDADGSGKDQVTLHGGQSPASMLSHDLQSTLWQSSQDDKPYPYGAIAVCPSGPVLVEGSLKTPSMLTITPMSGPSAGAASTFVLAGGARYASVADAMAAKASLGQLTSAATHANLTGAGRPSALVGSSDGHLYAVNPCDGSLDFAMDLGAAVGQPVFGDTDGDGKDEILVSVADGYLYDIKNEALPPPGFVWDIDLAHGITTDIDFIDTVDTLYCKWGAVPGATGYEVSIVAEAGGFVTQSPPWKPVDASMTVATLPGLSLMPGAKYFCAVRAVGPAGKSPDAESNGVVVGAPDAGADAGADAGPDAGVGPGLWGRACTCTAAGTSELAAGAGLAAAVAALSLAVGRRRSGSRARRSAKASSPTPRRSRR
jgi:outer membrane protein assembly factor BamB